MSSEAQSFKRAPSTQMASWFLDLNSAKRLDLDPPYQRRSVWSPEYRQFFIDSVIRNYPTQSIFIDAAVNPDSATLYRILDGKQRLTSLIMFIENRFSTPQSLEDVGLDNSYYSDLPHDVKTRILSYLFTVETVSNASPAELNQAFDRLNRNVLKLNKQELRHAQYSGAFVSKMEKIADDSFWENVGFVTPPRRRRMLDVEYISEFYIVAAVGIQDGKDYLDTFYAKWDIEIPDEREADQRFQGAKKYLERVNKEYPFAQSRFKNVADFYSAWAAVINLSGEKLATAQVAGERLAVFELEIEDQETPRSRDYLLASRQGSNKSSNRLLRRRILEEVFRG